MENLKFKKAKKWPITEVEAGKGICSYRINENAPFTFKLYDNSSLVKHLQTQAKESEAKQENYSPSVADVKNLKTTKLWIKNGDESLITLTLLDVYNTLIKHLKHKGSEDHLFNLNEVSFIGPLGPFKEMALIECINDQLVDQFVFKNVLANKLPSRKFRIHVEDKVLIQYGEELKKFCTLNIKQITDTGILFSSNDDVLLNELNSGDMVKFYINLKNLKNFIANDLKHEEKIDSSYFYTEDELSFFFVKEKNIVKSLSFKSSLNNEVFFFCRFHHMLESEAPNIFGSFVEKVKHYMHKFI